MGIPSQENFRVFFSWQSDVEEARSEISGALRKAASNVKAKLGVDIYIDEATRDLSGSQDIMDAISNKIRECDIFVGDVTPFLWISKRKDGEDLLLSPNPNVIFETGYAAALKGWSRVVLLCSLDNNEKIKDLPFDINHDRMDIINIREDNDLTLHLLNPIREILNHQMNTYPLFFDRQRLDFNKKSKKYIPEVFVDGYSSRQESRLFVDPLTFYSKEHESLQRMNFDYINRRFSRTGKQNFKFDLSGVPSKLKTNDFTGWIRDVEKLRDRLKNHADSLSASDPNHGYIASSKIKRMAERMAFAANQIMLVTGTAGQGKTNFLCDLADNILLPRQIPFLWINGYEIDPTDFEGSFLRRCLHSRYSSFHDAMAEARKLCCRIHKPFIVIIDGLNEIPYSARLCDYLNAFIATISGYNHIRLILTCREEYFKAYFKHYNFSDATIVRSGLNNRLKHDSEARERLLENYCEHFGISISLTDDDKKFLTDNLLRMRIFCEVNEGKTIERVDRRKYQLFEAYYSKAVERVTVNLNSVTGQNISEYDVRDYFSTIVGMMVENGLQSKIPIREVTSRLDHRFRGLFERFLDENILVKRDMDYDGEVVSFTYDEFRDYLIARYLVNEVLPADKTKFIGILSMLKDRSVSEGLIPFLFTHIFQYGNSEARDIIRNESWFDATLALNIWSLEDELLETADIERLKSLIIRYPSRISIELLRRWDSKRYPHLNITMLLDFVTKLDDTILAKYRDVAMPGPTLGRYRFAFDSDKSDREYFFEEMEKIVADRVYEKNPELVNLLRYMLIFLPSDMEPARILKAYLEDTGDKSIVSDMLTQTASEVLRENLSRWINQSI